MNQPSTYTPLEIANMFGVKPSTVYAWLSRKELEANKLGNNRVISQSQIRQFIESRKRNEWIDRTYSR
jgi:excisionase family DNA binding protein